MVHNPPMHTTTLAAALPTRRDLEPREARIIADALCDLRATSTRRQHARIVLDASVALGWSQAEVYAATNALAAQGRCYACDGHVVGVRGIAPEGAGTLPACVRHAEPGLGLSIAAVAS